MRLVRPWSEYTKERFWLLISIGWLLTFGALALIAFFVLAVALLGGFD